MPESEPTLPNFPQARRLEAWLDRLAETQSPASTSQLPAANDRIFFILDNDFGELTLVLYLVLGQACFGNARVLLSPRLYEKNKDALPDRTRLWTSEADLAEQIRTFQPKVVVFAAGYLLPVHDLLAPDAIGRLIEQAWQQGAAVVTTDPFLGLLSAQPEAGPGQLISIDIPENAPDALKAMKKSADAALHVGLAGAEAALRNVPHLYPSYTDMEGLSENAADSRNLTFFNDALLMPSNGDVNASPEQGEPHWMFTISEADFMTQTMFLGSRAFAEVVAGLLRQATVLGRHAILLGPDELLDLVRLSVGVNERIHLLKFCAFRSAMSLLLSAEYSFYWNVVSHSILMQLWNGLPVILFDRGHLARAAPTMYQRVIAWYYQGWEPPYLDHRATLRLALLEETVAHHARCRAEIMARFRRAPEPAALFESLARAER